MTYSDIQLKRAIPKLLPEQVRWDNKNKCLYYKSTNPRRNILDSELLQLCHSIETNINIVTLDNRSDYEYRLTEISQLNRSASSRWTCLTATWQQRIIALCQIKHIKII